MPVTANLLGPCVAAGTTGLPHAAGASSISLEPWQVINLVGSILLALLFLGPVLEDLHAWASALRQED